MIILNQREQYLKTTNIAGTAKTPWEKHGTCTIEALVYWVFVQKGGFSGADGQGLDAAEAAIGGYMGQSSSLDGVATMMKREELGATIDCAGSAVHATSSAHPVVVAVRDTVSLLSGEAQMMIMRHAGTRPDPAISSKPKYHPVGWNDAKQEGEREIMIVEGYSRSGRPITFRVPHTPVFVTGAAGAIAGKRESYAAWHVGMNVLTDELNKLEAIDFKVSRLKGSPYPWIEHGSGPGVAFGTAMPKHLRSSLDVMPL